MSRARRAAVLVAALAGVTLTLPGCSLSKPSTGVATAGSTAPLRALHSITYVNPLPNDPLWDRVGDCMKTAAKPLGVTVNEVGPPGGNVDLQGLENLDSQAIVNHTDALVTWTAGAPAAFDALLSKARQAGIPTITLLSSQTTTEQSVDIGTLQSAFAKLQIDEVASLPGVHHIGVLNQRPDGAGNADYVNGLKAEVAAHPNVVLDELAFDYGTFTDDVQIFGTMLEAHPDITELINYSGFPGVLTAIQEHHDVGKVRAVISSDFPKAAQSSIDQGLVAGVRVVPSCHIGQLAVQDLVAISKGQRVPAHQDEGDRVVTGQEFEHLAATGQL